jgi:hypothetical protein
MKIAVDYDGTLVHKSVQKYVEKLKQSGHDVQVVSTRWDEDNKYRYPYFKDLSEYDKEHLHDDLYEMCGKLRIVYNFTNMEWKTYFLTENGFEILIDDNKDERKRLSEGIMFVHISELNKLDKFLK